MGKKRIAWDRNGVVTLTNRQALQALREYAARRGLDVTGLPIRTLLMEGCFADDIGNNNPFARLVKLRAGRALSTRRFNDLVREGGYVRR